MIKETDKSKSGQEDNVKLDDALSSLGMSDETVVTESLRYAKVFACQR